jgi:hypothetical protein
MSANTLPLPIGQVFRPAEFDANSSLVKALLNNLGYKYTHKGAEYRLVKAAANLATPGRRIVTSALDATSKLPTWVVGTTTTANDPAVVGVIPADQVAILADDLYLVQISGAAEIVSAAAIAAGVLVGSSTTAGKGDDATIGAGVGAIGVSLEAAAGADENVAVLLKGLN